LVSAALPAYPADIFATQHQSSWNSDWNPVDTGRVWGLTKLVNRVKNRLRQE